MTNIDISVTDELIKIDMAGHAGYAEPGSDIVCSAISTLEYIVAAYIENNPSQAYLKRYETGPGYSFMRIIPKQNGIYEVIKAVISGYEAIADSYPENIKLKKIRKSGGNFLNNDIQSKMRDASDTSERNDGE